MKPIIISSIVLIILTSLCINIPLDFTLGDIGGDVEGDEYTGIASSVSSQDVTLNLRYATSEIRTGRDLFISFEIINRRSYDLQNVLVEVYDNPCFSVEGFSSDGTASRDIGNLNQESTRTWSWKMTPNEGIIVERQCPIRYKLSYEGVYSKYTDIVVLPEGEYFQRESDGTLGSINIESTSTSAPISVNLRFSEPQPFLENQGYYAYFDYYNTGTGVFDDLNVTISYPANIDRNECPLAVENIVFMRGKAPSTACLFNTNDVSAMDIKSLEMTANYKYSLDNSITIRVSP